MTLSKDSGVVMSAVSTLMRPPPLTTRPNVSSRSYSEDVIVPYRGSQPARSVVQKLTSLAGASGIALLLPIAMLIVGIPIALAARGVVEAVGWLAGWLLT